MVKRLISADASDIAAFTKEELIQSIRASEGRVVLSENVAVYDSIVGEITSAELSRAFGADMILLNGFDVLNPIIAGLNGYEVTPTVCADPIQKLKKLVGLPIGANLEPVDMTVDMAEDRLAIALGRQANIDTFKKANDMGLDFICLTGNPGVGVSNQAICDSIQRAKIHFKGMIIAGKMHYAGSSEAVVDLDWIAKFISSGADVLLLPAVGTVFGVGETEIKAAIDMAHDAGILVMSAIGTSQESADPQTIRDIALRNKILGADIQHIGDANMGLVGIRNITVLSDTIRGARHTVSRIARSIHR